MVETSLNCSAPTGNSEMSFATLPSSRDNFGGSSVIGSFSFSRLGLLQELAAKAMIEKNVKKRFIA